MALEVAGKKILLLQGPNGPFFRRLYDELTSGGAQVDKINLNAAEMLYFLGRRSIPYRGTFDAWPEFLRCLIEQERYDACFLFGDCRPYHVAARPVLDALHVPTFVFEDGYLRPHHLTIERSGVNSRSLLRFGAPDASTLHSMLDRALPPSPEPARHTFAWSVLHTIFNSLGVTLGAPFFPHYRHHRDVNTARQACLWALSGLRFAYYKLRERPLSVKLRTELSRKYFLVGLQVHNDSQVHISRFADVRDFIYETLESFLKHAPGDVSLVFKHHPADRAYRDYGALIHALAEKHNATRRIYYVHDLHLPTLLKHARGAVVINSTLGWSSLHHKTPIFALEETTYGYFGLSAPGTLEEFWLAPPSVDAAAVQAAVTWLRLHNQANGSVWTRVPSAGPSGIHWPPLFRLDDAVAQAPSDS
jgi:capsular polysaccharide export protein